VIDWERELSDAADRLLSSGTAPNLADSVRYSLLSGGKRFRPRLMEASAELLSLPSLAFIPFAVGLEMIHAFTLIHDDLPCMDDDDMRRGKPTNHKVYGEALALLAGDALVPMAFELCCEARTRVAEKAWAHALRRLLILSGPRGVIGGQALEMLLAGSPSLEKLGEMHALKTGALFDASILIPADLSGLEESDAKMKALAQFSHAFGLAFQTADDLDDAEQERDPVSGEYPKTSVLHYLSANEARDRASRALADATIKIQALWPSTHSSLVRVAAQLQSALGAGSG
jgi:geranylgeranyl pyrophosphate synthase